MNPLTLGDVRDLVAKRLNLCSTSDLLPGYINQAQRRLINKGQWVGVMLTYRICVSVDSCLVWPRQIASIERWALCTAPGEVRNRWYQFASQGPGQLDQTSGWSNELIMQDDVCAFEQITGGSTTSLIQVSTVLTESGSSEICLQGYDQNSQWIRTEHDGVVVDGEYVTISNVPVLTTNIFSKLVAVQKPLTNGPIILSEYLPGTGVVRVLAQYENDETRPSYRRSLLPGISNINGCGFPDVDSTCTSKQVTVLARLRHIDVRQDQDWLILRNPDAIAAMAHCCYQEEQNLVTFAQANEALAVRLLQDELNAYDGDGQIPTLNMEGSASWGAGVPGPQAAGWPYGWGWGWS